MCLIPAQHQYFEESFFCSFVLKPFRSIFEAKINLKT